MKLKYYSSLLLSAVCALALAACGGRSGGSGGSGGGSDDPSDDPSVETPQPLFAKYLLPEDVVAADMSIEGSDVTIEMRLDNVLVDGDLWIANVAHGTITLPADILGREDEGESVTVDLVSGIKLVRETKEGIILGVTGDATTGANGTDVVELQISGMTVTIPPIIDANETKRVGSIAAILTAQIYFNFMGSRETYSLVYDLQGATITLTNFQKRQ